VNRFETDTVVSEPQSSRRPVAARLADLGDRIARTLPQPKHAYPPEPPYGDGDYRVGRLARSVQDEVLPPFPITRQGYDCDPVDAHIAELEQEIAELERELDALRSQLPTRDAVAVELERVGEQTSTILVAAHDEAQQTVRLAQTHADTVIADAASYAVALTEQATLQLRELESQTEAVAHERARLLDEIRSTARALGSLADTSAERFALPG
jgi:hypothetical protein